MGTKFKKIENFIILFAAIIGILDFFWRMSSESIKKIFGEISGGIVIDFLIDRWISILAFGLLCIILFIKFKDKKREKQQQQQENGTKLENEKQELILKTKYSDTYPAIPNFPIWDAILYLQKETKIGKNKHWLEIFGLLREAAIAHKINIWVKISPGQKDFIRLTVNQIMDSFIEVQPSDPVGRIRFKDYTYMYEPTISREEIEKIFSKL